MSTLFRLPDNLGGHRVQIAGQRGDGQVIAIPDIDHGGDINRTEVHIARHKLVEVKPPLPPEPRPGSVVLDKDGDAWQREHGNDRPWAAAVFTQGVSEITRADWAYLNDAYGPLRLLVLDPLQDVPELPYVGRLGTRVEWEEPLELDGPRVYLTQGLNTASFSPDTADSLAELGAVITAAAARLRAARGEVSS